MRARFTARWSGDDLGCSEPFFLLAETAIYSMYAWEGRQCAH